MLGAAVPICLLRRDFGYLPRGVYFLIPHAGPSDIALGQDGIFEYPPSINGVFA